MLRAAQDSDRAIAGRRRRRRSEMEERYWMESMCLLSLPVVAAWGNNGKGCQARLSPLFLPDFQITCIFPLEPSNRQNGVNGLSLQAASRHCLASTALPQSPATAHRTCSTPGHLKFLPRSLSPTSFFQTLFNLLSYHNHNSFIHPLIPRPLFSLHRKLCQDVVPGQSKPPDLSDR
jgi:hypothetical protein